MTIHPGFLRYMLKKHSTAQTNLTHFHSKCQCKCYHHQKQGANPTWALPGWVGGTKPGEDEGTFTSTPFQLVFLPVFVLLFVRIDQFAFVH